MARREHVQGHSPVLPGGGEEDVGHFAGEGNRIKLPGSICLGNTDTEAPVAITIE
jgi:hypothetical protein